MALAGLARHTTHSDDAWTVVELRASVVASFAVEDSAEDSLCSKLNERFGMDITVDW